MDNIGSYLIEIIKQGGPLALWGIAIWLVLGIIRISVVCLAMYLVIKVICSTITANYKISKELSDKRVHLLSQEVSTRFTSIIDSFQKESLAILKELQTQLESLKKESKKI